MTYLPNIIKQFKYYQMLGDKTFAQLSDEQLFWKSDDDANSIAIIVHHLYGNMLSRWTDFLTSDGEKEWRKRDLEFEEVIQTKNQMLEKWNEGWDCLFTALNSINDENIDTIVYIRNIGHTIPEAINRQLAHYAYHVGQIVFIGRMLKEKNWQSLSIPKGSSKNFNKEKFDQPKRKSHFTDDLLDEKR